MVVVTGMVTCHPHLLNYRQARGPEGRCHLLWYYHVSNDSSSFMSHISPNSIIYASAPLAPYFAPPFIKRRLLVRVCAPPSFVSSKVLPSHVIVYTHPPCGARAAFRSTVLYQ